MIYKANKGQVYYGFTVGILMLDTYVPMIPGDVGNATTYSYPVLYRTLDNVTATKIANKDSTVVPEIIAKGQELVKNGAKAITADCGFLLYYQNQLRDALQVPVFLSSLLQLPFLFLMVNTTEKIGVITADSTLLNEQLLTEIGIQDMNRLSIKGLQNTSYFYDACVKESGVLNEEGIKQEVVSLASQMVQEDPDIKAILLECSFLPPYSKAVQEAVGLPVFDYKTMIDYVHSAYRAPIYNGFL
ncbi:aspartate/glutamate racemase family protein [Oceanobacillus halotolerans]|uniref:aspartate/glutamate racemase family protein n=1 Tax=Oceanobacillus halotolerans TaxID=2663380 RepID=UPI0013DB8B85|nr:aspartate/glutamate racemase family protein [Oceanobacillus halotolerans]